MGWHPNGFSLLRTQNLEWETWAVIRIEGTLAFTSFPHSICSSQGSEVDLNTMSIHFFEFLIMALQTPSTHTRLVSIPLTNTLISLTSWCLYLSSFWKSWLSSPGDLLVSRIVTFRSPLLLISPSGSSLSQQESCLLSTPRAFAGSYDALALCYMFSFPSRIVISPRAETVHPLS